MTKSSRCVRRAAVHVALGAAAVAGLAAPSLAQAEYWDRNWDPAMRARYEDCIAKTKVDPATAYEDALIFRNQGGGALARHCVALALLELGEVEEAAARLEETAFMPDGGDADMRAELLSQAGNAWLVARAPVEAEHAFTQAMTIKSADPDLFIDRARALALQDRFAEAVGDLTVALSVRPRDVLALRLRADAHLELGELEEAERDVEQALAINSQDVDTLVVRGRIREARRLGLEAVLDPSAGDRAAAPTVLPDGSSL